MAKQQKITIEDIVKLGPKKLILIFLAAIVVYFSGGDLSFFGQSDVANHNNDDSDIVQGVVAKVTMKGA